MQFSGMGFSNRNLTKYVFYKIKPYQISVRTFCNNLCNKCRILNINHAHRSILNSTHRLFSSQEKASGLVLNSKKDLTLTFLDLNNTENKFICPNISLNVYPPADILTELKNSSSVDEVFETLKGYPGNLSLDIVSQAVYSLSRIKNFRQLKFKNSALHEDLEEKFLLFIKENEEFKRLITFIKETVNVNNRIPSVMMCLDNLKLDISHDVMVDLHISILKQIQSFELEDLVQISFVFHNKGLKGYFTQCKLLKETNKIIEGCSLDEFLLLSFLFVNTKRLISKEKSILYVKMLEKFVENNFLYNLNAEVILIFIKTLHILLRTDAPVYIIRALMMMLVNQIQDLTPHQLIILNNIFLTVLEPRITMYRIQEHASRLIDESNSSDLNSELLLCLAPNSSFKKRSYYEDLALKQIEAYDFQDPASLYKTIKFLMTSDSKLCQLFWSKAMDNVKKQMKDTETFVGERHSLLHRVYGKYIFFHNNLGGKFRYFSLEKELVSFLKEELKGLVRFYPSKVAHILGFIIGYSEGNELEDEWYELLKRSCHQFDEFDVAFLSRGFHMQITQKYALKEKINFLYKVGNLLDTQSSDLLRRSSSLRSVVTLTTAYVNRHGSTLTSLLDSLASEHLKYMDQLNSKTMTLMLRNFKNVSYNSPQVFESVADYFVENEEAILSTTAEKAITCLYSLGFHTSYDQKFYNICQKIIKWGCTSMQCHSLLESCLALCFYRSLSSDLIHYIFNIEFLDQVDEEIASSYSKNYPTMVRSLLMKLNRSVCVDYPEEKIPWFHENYCLDQAELYTEAVTPFHKEIHTVLTRILGGASSISLNTKSPYYYNLDLEFSLGKDGKPIPCRQGKGGKGPGEEYQSEPFKRVAILLRDDACYSCNDRTLNGPCQLERRHLEILGFVVVEVPQHSWYSMAMARPEDKCSLLKSLIYKELDTIS